MRMGLIDVDASCKAPEHMTQRHRGTSMKLMRPPTESVWTRTLSRREVLRRGAFLAGGLATASLAGACSTSNGGQRPSVDANGDVSQPTGAITVISHAGDIESAPSLVKVYDDFKAQNPGIEWDIRRLPGGGPEWDRLARAAVSAGEPVGLVLINGQQVRGWVRDGLLADLDSDPGLADVLARVPERYHLSGPGETATRAFPLALTRGVHTTGIYYNKALLDEAGLGPPTTIADLKAMVQPLAELGAAPLVHCSGDVFFNQMLVTWLLPMIAERSGDPLAFAESTVRGEIGYDAPEWIETFETIADLRRSGVLLEGSGAVDYATMQRLLLQGKAAATFNGSWLLPLLQAGSPTGPFELHVAPPPLLDGAVRPRPLLAWTGVAVPAAAPRDRASIHAFLEYASRPAVDRAIVEGLQSYSPIAASNEAIEDPVAQEFLPMFDDAITPLDWLWEPEITAEIDGQVQALVKGDSDAASAGRAIEAVAEELRTSGRSYYPSSTRP
jgi:ABC-type glycerol-3-phosphate transport system substrate-binding protein